MPTPPTYPFDPTGQLPSNLITGEIHTLSDINASTYRIIIPKMAPFFLDNFKMVHIDTLGNEYEMQETVDFRFCLEYLGASRSIGKMLYGGATINRDDLNGTIRVEYQTLGGEWMADADYVLLRLSEMNYNPRVTVWDVVTNKPSCFPPINHDQYFDYVFGMEELIEAIDRVRDAILQGPNPGNMMMKHILIDENPHGITAETVELENVENLPVATAQEIQNGDPVRKYVTLEQLILSGVLP